MSPTVTDGSQASRPSHKAHGVYSRALWPPCLLTSLSLSLASFPALAFWHRLVIGVLSRLLPFETVNFSRRHPTTTGGQKPRQEQVREFKSEGFDEGSLFRLQTDDRKFDSDFISRERQEEKKSDIFLRMRFHRATVSGLEGLRGKGEAIFMR